jgi:hypothetical protein
MNVEAQARLAGKTLYVSFEIQNMVTASFDLPKEVTDNLESAMLSISRIALSTDAKIDFTVIEAEDLSWGVETILIRRMQDLKDLFYWRISKSDFDERLILETRKIPAGEKPAGKDWRDISLPEFMSRLVASRISLGTKANPILNVLFGIEKMTAQYDGEGKTVSFTADTSPDVPSSSTSSVTLSLLKSSVLEQMARVEKKYLRGPGAQEAWAESAFVRNINGDVLFQASREEWLSSEKPVRVSQ